MGHGGPTHNAGYRPGPLGREPSDNARGRSVSVLRRRIVPALVARGPAEIKTDPLGRGPAGPIAPAVVTGRRGWRGVAHQLLDRRQVGTGVEEVTGVGRRRSWGEMAAKPVARVRRERTWRMASPLSVWSRRRLPLRSMGQKSGPGESPLSSHPVLEERPDSGGEGHQPLLAALPNHPDGGGVLRSCGDCWIRRRATSTTEWPP